MNMYYTYISFELRSNNSYYFEYPSNFLSAKEYIFVQHKKKAKKEDLTRC